MFVVRLAIMALGKCRECGKEVSKSAKTCPSCGVSTPVKGVSILRIAGGVIGFIVLARLCSGAGTKPSSTVAAAAMTPEAPVAAAAAEKAPPTPEKLEQLDAQTLISAYKANEVAADAKYQNRRFKIVGTVRKIDSGLTGAPTVWIGAGYEHVMLKGISKNFAASLQKGELIEVACKVTGEVIGTPTADCE